MKIVNAHTHLLEVRGHDEIPTNVSLLKGLDKSLPLLKAEELLRQMDEAHIDVSVLFAVVAPIVYASNEYVASICRAHPDRFIGFASVDVHRTDAGDVLRAAVEDQGFRGFKFHPPLQQFMPDDPLMHPIYELAVELNVPVVFHTGSTPFGKLARLKMANPIVLDEVAVTFSALRMMITHLGTLWHNEAMMVAEKNPNVFIDTAEYPPWIRRLLTEDVVERVGEDKYIFGTDYPMPYKGEAHDLKMYVECIKDLPLSKEAIAGILGGNFELLLHGRNEPQGMVSAEALLSCCGAGSAK